MRTKTARFELFCMVLSLAFALCLLIASALTFPTREDVARDELTRQNWEMWPY